MTHPTDIVAYDYAADRYCPSCIIDVLTADGGPFDGWALGFSVRMEVEQNLDEIADAFGINRGDERTFDSGDFPKVVFADNVEEDEFCAVTTCFNELE